MLGLEETIDPEHADELDIPLDKLGKAVDKLTEKEIIDVKRDLFFKDA